MNAGAETALASVRADQAAIQSAQSATEASKVAVENVRVMLTYASIRSPLSGRTGNLGIKEGNVIGPNTDLMTINQVEPIYVVFSISETQLRLVKKGQTVIVSAKDSLSPEEAGRLFFIDNIIDTSTGTIRIKAVFPN